MEVKTFMMNVIENVVDVTKKGAAESSEASGTQTSSELTILSSNTVVIGSDANRPRSRLRQVLEPKQGQNSHRSPKSKSRSPNQSFDPFCIPSSSQKLKT